MAGIEKPGTYTTLRRGLAILETLSTSTAIRQGGMTVGDLSRTLESDKSQISRTLSVLVEHGYVLKEPSSRLYRIGWRLYTAAVRATDTLLLAEAHAALEKLAAEYGEQAHMVALEGAQAVTISAMRPFPAVHDTWVGRSIPVHYTASGRALVMDESLDALERRLGGSELDMPTERSPRTVAELYERLGEARATGYVIVDEEMESGVLAVAAPVRELTGSTRTAIGLVGSASRFRPRVDAAGSDLVAAAQELSDKLNGRSLR